MYRDSLGVGREGQKVKFVQYCTNTNDNCQAEMLNWIFLNNIIVIKKNEFRTKDFNSTLVSNPRHVAHCTKGINFV